MTVTVDAGAVAAKMKNIAHVVIGMRNVGVLEATITVMGTTIETDAMGDRDLPTTTNTVPPVGMMTIVIGAHDVIDIGGSQVPNAAHPRLSQLKTSVIGGQSSSNNWLLDFEQKN